MRIGPNYYTNRTMCPAKQSAFHVPFIRQSRLSGCPLYIKCYRLFARTVLPAELAINTDSKLNMPGRPNRKSSPLYRQKIPDRVNIYVCNFIKFEERDPLSPEEAGETVYNVIIPA